MQTQGAFNLLFRPGLRTDFRDTWDRYEPEYPMFLKTGTADLPEISASIITGPNRLLELGDGESVTYESARMGPKVMAVDKEFGLGISVSRKTIEDDQYGKMRQAAKWLAEAARLTSEARSAALLDDAFAGATFLGFDSLALCHTAHTFLNASGTWANRPTSDIGLSVSGITACLDLFMLMKNHNADPIKMMPDKLIIGNNAGDLHRALKIWNSTLEPFTADNDDNAIRRRYPKMNIEVSRFKSSVKSYFLIDSRYNDAHYDVKRPVKMEDDFDFNTGAALYKATTRFFVYFFDPRGWVGVSPT